jgi:GxxExxY protein
MSQTNDKDNLTYSVIGAAIAVHRNLGPGYLENIYEEALAIELAKRKIPFERQKVIHVEYEGQLIGESRLDYLIDKRLILELKAVEKLAPIHTAQVISYLKMTKVKFGLLINFNVQVLREGIIRVAL